MGKVKKLELPNGAEFLVLLHFWSKTMGQRSRGQLKGLDKKIKLK